MANQEKLEIHAKIFLILTREIRGLEDLRAKYESKLLAAGPGRYGGVEVVRSDELGTHRIRIRKGGQDR